jgi:lysophospholipase L1-like esterase
LIGRDVSRLIALGVVAGVAVAAALPAGAQDSADLALEWSVPDRIPGPRFFAGVARDPRSAAIAPTVVRLRAVGDGGCTGLKWKLDDKAARPEPLGGCAFELDLGDHGSHEVVLERGSQEATASVQARNLLVVSVGDSVASGEGNPDKPSSVRTRWLERRCHRSMRSGAAQAALAVERGDRQSEVTFLPLGCSGATVPNGLVRPYEGIQPDRRLGDLPAQLSVVKAVTARQQIDALLLSIGANDVNFGPLLQFCIAVEDCRHQRFDPEARIPRPSAAAQPAAAVERNALAALPSRYRQIADVLDEAGVDPTRVIIVEYFDPVRDAGGAPCKRALPGIRKDEAGWAETAVLGPLNGEVRAAADRHRWRVVTGVADAFATHGVCVRGSGRWVRRPEESLSRQARLSGTFHPNGRGHLATAALIAPVLADTLGITNTGSSEIAGTSDDEDSGVPAWWLVIAALVGALLGISGSLLVRRLR